MIKDDSLRLLEFHKILLAASEHCHGGATRAELLAIRPMTDRADIDRSQGELRDFMRLLSLGQTIAITEFIDLAPLTDKLRPAASVLESAEIYAFSAVFNIASNASLILKDRDAELPNLCALAGGLTGFPDLDKTITRSINSEGEILDSASHLLKDLRSRIRALDRRIMRRLQEMTQEGAGMSSFLQDDFITKRSGRWVVPVRMDSKGMVEGVVHDVSRSGETAFVEPLEIIGLSNELENLNAEARAEEIRILRSISAELRSSIDGISAEFKAVVRLDAVSSVAALAKRLDMTIPQITDGWGIRIIKGRHPLLVLRHGSAVPLNIKFGGGDSSAVVITGPNAGGKTIALKTIGLLSMMANSGLPVPADEGTEFPLLSGILVDIGDEQSIESNQSTFSAHISNISSILKSASKGSLVLLDELGTGTDPAEGAAIGCGVLNSLVNHGSVVVATTHLIEIVGFVQGQPSMTNASMLFDSKTLMPLYRLDLGAPGRSYAFEIARRFGMPDEVLDFAREISGGGTPFKMVHDLMAGLKEQQDKYELSLRETESLRKSLLNEESKLKDLRVEIERAKTETLRAANEQAAILISDIKRKAFDLLEEAKKGRRAALKELEEERKKIADQARRLSMPEGEAIDIENLKEGDGVVIVSTGAIAEVVRVNKKDMRLRLKIGSKEMEIPVDEVRAAPVQKHISKEKKVRVIEPVEADVTKAESPRVMLIGMRVDEALMKLEQYLNQASMAGHSNVTIVHGIGTGALRRGVRELLKGHPLIESFRPGERTEGGDGVTVAELK